eukprot:11411144-Prorocentrum_lima.AAC.1
MTSSLVGSEMCIRDRRCAPHRDRSRNDPTLRALTASTSTRTVKPKQSSICLLYTSDAADDM